jgi:hypothetical protein
VDSTGPVCFLEGSPNPHLHISAQFPGRAGEGSRLAEKYVVVKDAHFPGRQKVSCWRGGIAIADICNRFRRANRINPPVPVGRTGVIGTSQSAQADGYYQGRCPQTQPCEYMHYRQRASHRSH